MKAIVQKPNPKVAAQCGAAHGIQQISDTISMFNKCTTYIIGPRKSDFVSRAEIQSRVEKKQHRTSFLREGGGKKRLERSL